MPTRVPNGLKLVRGTARPGRQPSLDSGSPLTRRPPPPARLSQRAAAEWRDLARELVAAGVLTGGDLRALELLATTLALEAEMAELVRLEGATVPGEHGSRKGHPGLRIGAEARNQAIRLLGAFGLTPSSRERVPRVGAPDDAGGVWARLRTLQGSKAQP